ncbi:MAG: Multidrug-efflux transporter, major facilitator superfamily (MFS) [Anaerolineae bacterium]|nr:MAG: Multidrug-efflux transporter, major facilitator superfamily (MFS) [Anaerolineae bacterium]
MNRDFVILIISLILWGIGEGSFFSFIPLYLQELGAKAFQIGGIMGGLSFAAMLCHLPAGYLADKLGRRTLIIASWAIGLVATILMFLTKSLPLFMLSLFLYGATAFVLAPLNSYVAHAAPHGSLNRILTIISASFNFGYMFGPLIGGFLGETFGLRNLFLFAAILFLISTILVFALRSQPITPSPKGMAFFRSIFNLRFSGFVLVIALTIFATYLPQPLSPNYLQNQKLLPLTSIGFLFFVNGGGIVTFNLLLGTFAPLLGIFTSQVLVMLFSLLLINTNTLPTFMLAFFILGSYRAAHTVSVAQLRNYIQPESMGLAYGFAESVFALAMILASFFAGYLYENNPTAMYSTSILLILVALAFTLGFTFLTRSNAEKSTSKLNSADKQNELSLPESEQTLS